MSAPHNRSQPESYNLHLVSDATGETLNAVAKAVAAQFDGVRAREHFHALVRGPRQMDKVLKKIKAAPGIVLFTIVSDDVRRLLEEGCRELNVPHVAVLDPVIGALSNFLNLEISHRVGVQHALNAEYFAKIEALNFTMAHDDGQNPDGLGDADIIILGVSRTSKTPTSIYLANRGIKVANIPLVPGIDLPPGLAELKKPFIVGLVASPDRLVQIRRNRLLSLKADSNSDYTDLDMVKREVADARRLYTRHGWQVIDVTRRSIEETAAAIYNHYLREQDGRDG